MASKIFTHVVGHSLAVEAFVIFGVFATHPFLDFFNGAGHIGQDFTAVLSNQHVLLNTGL